MFLTFQILFLRKREKEKCSCHLMSWNPPKLQVKSIKIYSNSKKTKQTHKGKKKKERKSRQTNKKQTETVLPGFPTQIVSQ